MDKDEFIDLETLSNTVVFNYLLRTLEDGANVASLDLEILFLRIVSAIYPFLYPR